MRIIPNLLWIDCTAGALVGVLALSFSGWLSRLYSMPVGVLYFMGIVNLLYAAYSFSLAIRHTRPRALITLLVAANGVWSLVCLGMAAHFFETATVFGIGQLVGEAIFVCGLACLEWKWRDRLLSTATPKANLGSGGVGVSP